MFFRLAAEALLTWGVGGCGHVLFTSRNRDLGRLGTLLEIPPLATEEGVRLLLRGYNGNDIQEPHQDTASKITKRLGGLALAIDQAAAYIKYKRVPLDRLGDFLTTYEAERQTVLSYTPNNFWEYKHINAITTWELSFQQLGSGDEPWKESAAHFLTLSAFFAPTTITESIFRYYHKVFNGIGYEIDWLRLFTEPDGVQNEEDGKDGNGEGKDEETDQDRNKDEAGSQSSDICFHRLWSPHRFWDVIASSEELSLLQSISPGTGQEGACFSLHPLIRDWLQLRLKTKERTRYTHEAVSVLSCCAQAYSDFSTSLAERTALLSHMQVSLANEEKFLQRQDRLGYQIASCNAASRFAYVFRQWGQHRTSEDLTRRVLDTRRSELIKNHPDTLKSMNSLAGLLDDVGNYEGAEKLYHQTLMMRESKLEKEHLETLASMNGLAIVLLRQGKYKEAESMSRRALTLVETKFGKQHPVTLVRMNNLAGVLRNQNKYKEVEQIYRETLKSGEMVLGKQHPNTLAIMNNLAVVLSDQNKYEEAEQINRETLTLKRTVLGKNHPDTLSSLNNVASALNGQHKHNEAERICRETLALRETVLGVGNPETVKSREFLMEILESQDK